MYGGWRKLTLFLYIRFTNKNNQRYINMEVKVNIPTDLSELSLQQYSKYLEMITQYEQMKDETKNPDVFYMLKTLEIFCGINYEDGLKIRVQDVRSIVSKIENLLTQKPELVTRFQVGDIEFGFIPKLDEMTFGEYIDIDTNLGNWSNMHKAMAVLYRPIKKKDGEKYLIEDYKGDLYHDAMKHTPLDAVLSCLVFFYHLGIDLSNAMTRYLEEASPEVLERYKTLEENGVGINRSIRLLRETLQDLRM